MYTCLSKHITLELHYRHDYRAKAKRGSWVKEKILFVNSDNYEMQW